VLDGGEKIQARVKAVADRLPDNLKELADLDKLVEQIAAEGAKENIFTTHTKDVLPLSISFSSLSSHTLPFLTKYNRDWLINTRNFKNCWHLSKITWRPLLHYVLF
jgi:hypothetical protein